MNGKDVKVAEVLDQAAAGLEKGFKGSKTTEAALLGALGRSYMGLGNVRQVSRGIPQACGPGGRSDRTTSPPSPGRNNLANAYRAAGRYAEAIATLHESTLKLSESKLGPVHSSTLSPAVTTSQCLHGRRPQHGRTRCTSRRSSQWNRSSAPITPTRSPAATASPLPTSPQAATPLRSRCTSRRSSKLESKLGPDHPNTLNTRKQPRQCLQGRWPKRRGVGALSESTLKLKESKLGPDHPDTLISRNILAVAYMAVGRNAEAIALHELDAQAARVEARPRSPRHTQLPQQPRHCLLQAGPAATP